MTAETPRLSYPGHWARVEPDKPAVILTGSGEVVTWAQLDERSNRLARHLHESGLRPGDHMAVLLDNGPRFHEVVWAALRSGLMVTPVNYHLTAAEAGYIIDNCDAKALVTSASLPTATTEVGRYIPRCPVRLMIGGTSTGFEAYEAVTASARAEPLDEEPLGGFMLYSSGTTGRPKGIRRPVPTGSARDGLPFAAMLHQMFGMDGDTVYLSPAPLYHSAPLGFTTGVQSLGGTTVVMERFEPEAALAAMERYRVDYSQWVPTMFSRLLKLPADRRSAYDLSAHTMAIHAAAPCPVPVKEAMLEWWGPIIHEYYGGSELNGLTYCTPSEWLQHKGTVGRAVFGVLHVCGENGEEVPPGTVGTVYFEQPTAEFHYHKDSDQTRTTRHPKHPNWTALGDIGRVDADGYLYLTDRAKFTIIAGGVNIYPQEIEDCLITHPLVDDVAVFGVPNDDLGEEVKAVVQLVAGVEPGEALEEELLAWTKERLSLFKCPRTIDFDPQLPRLPTGKLYKRVLRDRYWPAGERAPA